MKVSQNARVVLARVEDAPAAPMRPPAKLSEEQRILAITDPIQRNARINAAYAGYARTMDAALAVDQANFGHYLTLGSSSIGKMMASWVAKLFGATDRLGDGNKELFAMTAPHFAAFAKLASKRDDAAFNAFLSHVVATAQTPDNATFARAFTQYYLATKEPDLALRRQRVYLGNILFAYVEQQAAQPVLDRTIPKWLQPWLSKVIGRFELPSQTLRVHEDVPGPYARQLETITLPELKAQLETFGRGANSTEGSGTNNWFRFDGRYPWIIELFRTQAGNREILAVADAQTPEG